MKKFMLGVFSITLTGALALPGNVSAVKADSYYDDFPTAAEAASKQSLSQANSDIVYADYFHQLEALEDLLDNFGNGISLASDEMTIKRMNTVQIGLKSRLNSISEKRNELAAELSYINDATASKILSDYLKAINRYAAANQYLAAYYTTGTRYNFSMYLKNSSEAFNLHAYAGLDAKKRYGFYIQRAYDALNNAGY
ncbi:hypothetical protein B9G55_01535 [Saccharibacillus sp. O16]|nr:hypothetical protein B9G55_01535 [Saccharibacillus sp. O16]